MAEIYNYFSEMLKYPSDQTWPLVNKAMHIGTEEVRSKLENFCSGAPRSLEKLEELYIGTFEVSPTACLYAGYTVFGETFKRSHLLVGLKDLLARAQIQTDDGGNIELPDHIPLLLRFLGTEDCGTTEERNELVRFLLFPALIKALDDLRKNTNPYAFVIEALMEILTRDFQESLQ